MVFYVGYTNDVPTRLKEHISLANSGLPNQKDIVIQDILKSGCLPIIDEIEFLYDEKEAKKAEAYWIGQFIEWGFSLCNISHGIVKAKETRKGLKICLVCGIDFSGTNAAQTCSTKCRTRMSRMIADGKKPEFLLIAKSKGQKVPEFKKEVTTTGTPKNKTVKPKTEQEEKLTPFQIYQRTKLGLK